MKYEKLLEKLREDTSVEELKQYLTGEKKFNPKATTKEIRQNLITNVIPALIANMKKDNIKESKAWYNAYIFKLAHQRRLTTRQPISTLFDIAKQIIDRLNKDSDCVAIRQRVKEYAKRTKETEEI
jgi:hypothetical protein